MHILVEFKEKYYINFNYFVIFSLLFNINIHFNQHFSSTILTKFYLKINKINSFS